MTTNDANAAPEIEDDHLTHADVVIARTVSPELTTEVSLAFAFQRLGSRGCVLFRAEAAQTVLETWGNDGSVAMLRLIEVVDGHRQRAVVVGGKPHWLRKVISTYDRQAIIIDERGQCWLGEANGHDQPLSDDFDPEEVCEVVGCAIGATEVGYDVPPQGFFNGMCERHLGGDQVSDAQRYALLAKLQGLRRRGYLADEGKSDGSDG